MHKWKTAAIKIIELDSDLEKYPVYCSRKWQSYSKKNEESDPNSFKDQNKIVVEHIRCIFMCTENFSKDDKQNF